MAWVFNRHVEEKIITDLENSKLWNKKLKEDCEKGEVFLALRKDKISFYHGGGNLFNFDEKDFSTHIKYAAVIDQKEEENNYVSQTELGKRKLIADFWDGYKQIKVNCSHYSGDEAKGVASLCKNSSYLSYKKEIQDKKPIVVLDIEVVFNNKENKDRIDILLYNTESKQLRFVEAKHFSNSELWATGEPKVIGQIARYEAVIETQKTEIIAEYGRYIEGINRIFCTKLPAPVDIDPKVSLLIFGFDVAQRKGERFKKLIWDKPEYQQIPIYPKGDPKGLNAETLWNEAK